MRWLQWQRSFRANNSIDNSIFTRTPAIAGWHNRAILKPFTTHIIAGICTADLAEDRPVPCAAGGKAMMLIRHNGVVHLLSRTCPHAGADLCDGFVDARGRIVCPAHGYRFDCATGRNASGEGYTLRRYAVRALPNGSLEADLPADTL